MNYPFEIKVYVQKRPWLRDPNLEYLYMLGFGVLQDIFDREVINTTETLTLYFPERHLNLVEERSLYDRLKTYCPKLKKLEIMTSSVLILQCTSHKNILILESPDEIENGSPIESATGRLWRDNCHGYDFTKLQVF